MKKHLLVLMALILMLTALLTPAALATDTAEAAARMLRVAVRTDIAGFGSYDPNAKVYSGMEIDLARELALRMGFDGVTFVGVTADEREGVLLDGEADCAIALYTVTDQRREMLDFTQPYFTSGLRVMVQRSTLFTSVTNLHGSYIAVRNDMTARLVAEALMRAKVIPEFDPVTFDAKTFDGGVSFLIYGSYAEMINALECGEADAVCADGSILAGFNTDERRILHGIISREQYAIGLAKGSPLTERADAALGVLLEEGVVAQLIEKWNLTEFA